MVDIIVVEDDINACKYMCAILERRGFRSHGVHDGLEALDFMEGHTVDLIILDVMMPHMDGYALCRQLREVGDNKPILMVTANQEIQDKHKGFVAGTDDYMTKPYDEQELIYRVKALLRRAKIASENKVTLGKTVADYDTMMVAWDNQTVTLPKKEFQLLFKLMSYPEVIFTRNQLMDEIWGLETLTDEHTLNVHINRLRDRLRDNSDVEIVTVRGLGYKIRRQSL